MRVLLVRPGPTFSVADVARGWGRGLVEAGAYVWDYNHDDRLGFYCTASRRDAATGEWIRMVDDATAVLLAANGIKAACYQFQPQVVLVVSGFYMPDELYEVLRVRGSRVVLLCTESPYEDESQLRRAPLVDVVLLNDPTNIDRFRAVNPHTYYMPHAYDPAVHHPRPAKDDLRSDFCLVGTGYPSRMAFLEAVDWTGIDVALAGNWQRVDEESPLRPFLAHEPDRCIDNTDAVDLYASTKASANLYRREAEADGLAEGVAMTPREVELAACGTFFLREHRAEGDALLPMLPTFDGPGDFGDKLHWWLEHDDERDEMARQAQAAVADRTFVANARQLLSLIDRL